MTDHTETLLRLSNVCLEIDQCKEVLAKQGAGLFVDLSLRAAIETINNVARELQAPNRRESCRVVEISGGTR